MRNRLRQTRRIQQARQTLNTHSQHQAANQYALDELRRDKRFVAEHPGWNQAMVYWLRRIWSDSSSMPLDDPDSRKLAYEFVFVTNGGSAHAQHYLRTRYQTEKGKDKRLHIPELEAPK